MKITKTQCYVLPEGIHEGKITGFNIKNEGTASQVLQLTVQATSLSHPLKNYVAKKTYKASDDQLAKDLDNLCGDDIHSVVSMDGDIIPSGLKQLVGMEIEFEIEHYQSDEYEQPYCFLHRIRKMVGLRDEIREVA